MELDSLLLCLFIFKFLLSVIDCDCAHFMHVLQVMINGNPDTIVVISLIWFDVVQ